MSVITRSEIELPQQKAEIKPVLLSPMSSGGDMVNVEANEMEAISPQQEYTTEDFMFEEADTTIKDAEYRSGRTPHDLYLKGKEYEAKEDVKKAMEYFQNAADEGHLSAMVSYALLLISTDEAMAFDWLRMAADHGNGRAFYHLGQLYARGSLFRISPSTAAKCWSRSAELGDSCGRSALGLCYVRGFGVRQDIRKGVEMVKQVAMVHQDLTAMKNLAWIFEKGKGVLPDAQEAAHWRARAQQREVELKKAEQNWHLWEIRQV